MPSFRNQNGNGGLVGIGVLAPPFHPDQNGCGFSFTKESSLIDALTHPSRDRDGISPPLQLKREERFIWFSSRASVAFVNLNLRARVA